MAAHETRLLILGAVKLFEPVNGYQIRRELISWNVDRWTYARTGSIYSALGTLTKRGMLARHDLADGGRPVAVYTVTEAGNAEFLRLYARAMVTVEPGSPVAFHTALALALLVPRERFAGWLRERVAALAARDTALAAQLAGASGPAHTIALAQLWQELNRVEQRWCRAVLEQAERGELAFAGEPLGWAPPADDPGWQIQRDRQRYLEQLGRG